MNNTFSQAIPAFCNLTTAVVQFMNESADVQLQKRLNIPQSWCHEVASDKNHFQKIISIEKVRGIYVTRFYVMALFSILLYDHILTIGEEIQGFWCRRKFNRVSALFFVNRYLPIVLYSLVLMAMLNDQGSISFCEHFLPRVVSVLIVLSETVIGLLLVLKTRALWTPHLSLSVALLIIFVYLSQIVLGIMIAVRLRGYSTAALVGSRHFSGCAMRMEFHNEYRLISFWFSNILFNVLIFMCTLKKTLLYRVQGVKGPLHTLMFRDGIIYFLVILAAKFIDLIMLVVFPFFNTPNFAFLHILDVILTSRLLLNLRSVLQRDSQPYGQRLLPTYQDDKDVIDISPDWDVPPQADIVLAPGEKLPSIAEMITHILYEEGYGDRIFGPGAYRPATFPFARRLSEVYASHYRDRRKSF